MTVHSSRQGRSKLKRALEGDDKCLTVAEVVKGHCGAAQERKAEVIFAGAFQTNYGGNVPFFTQ